MKTKDKLELSAVVASSLLISAMVAWPVGIVTAGVWGVWRFRRWRKDVADEVARGRGYKDFDDFRKKNK